MLKRIMDKLGYISKKESDDKVRINVYNTLVYCEQRNPQQQFKYEKHMHEVIYKLADMAKVEVEHKLDSRGKLRIEIKG